MEEIISYFMFWLLWTIVLCYTAKLCRFCLMRYCGEYLPQWIRGGDSGDSNNGRMEDRRQLNQYQNDNYMSGMEMGRARLLHGMTKLQREEVLGLALDNNSAITLSNDNKGTSGDADTVNICIDMDEDDQVCVICLNDCNDNDGIEGNHVVHSIYCKHKFHKGCLLPWVKKKNECPW